MKAINLTRNLLLLAAPIMVSCQKEAELPKPCIEGRITSDLIYKSFYSECYHNVLWIEVISDTSLGEDVEIFTPSPSTNPTPPIKYTNVIEVPLPYSLKNNTQIDTLLGKKVFFQYKNASDDEKNSNRNDSCNEIYDSYNVPFLVLTYFSLNQCSQSPETIK